MPRMKKGEVVSLIVFLAAGLLISNYFVAGAYVEDLVTQKLEFEGPGDSSAAMQASVLYGIYTAEGEPVEVLSFQGRVANGGSGLSYKNVAHDWGAEVRSITIHAENIDRNSLRAEISWRIDEPVEDTKILNDKDLRSGDFSFTTSGAGWTATTKAKFNHRTGLMTMAKKYKFDYKKKGLAWRMRVKIKVWGVSGGKEISAEPFNHEQRFNTQHIEVTAPPPDPIDPWRYSDPEKWPAGPPAPVGDPFLTVSGVVYPGVMGSFLNASPVGLSLSFVVMVLFVGIWYKWGRKLQIFQRL